MEYVLILRLCYFAFIFFFLPLSSVSCVFCCFCCRWFVVVVVVVRADYLRVTQRHSTITLLHTCVVDVYVLVTNRLEGIEGGFDVREYLPVPVCADSSAINF